MALTNTKRMFKDSGQLTLTNSTEITAGATYVFNLDERFIPYDEATIVNLNSDNDTIIKINSKYTSSLPKGNQIELNGHNITQIWIINNGATTINANEIFLTYRHTGNEGKLKLSKIQNSLGLVSSLKVLGAL